MKVKFALAVVIAALAAPVAANAQGIIGGSRIGVVVGQQAFGPIGAMAGAVVGGAIGGVVGGAVGAVNGAIGIPQGTGLRY
jgi:hypothetical protein